MKKQKVIHLSSQAVEVLSISAIKAGTNFKNYVEEHLESLAKSSSAVKAVRQKKKS